MQRVLLIVSLLVSSLLCCSLPSRALAQEAGTVTVHVTTTAASPLTLHQVVVAGPASRWSGRYLDATRPLCTTPCDLQLPVGPYHFGVSAGDPNAHRVPNLLDIRQPTSLEIEYESRLGLRILGWILFGISAAAGAGIAIAGATFAADAQNDGLFYGLTIGGLSLVVVGGVVSLPFIAFEDHALVRPID